MTKIKILYLVSTLRKCGPVNILYGIVKSLDKHQFDIYIACLSKENKSSMKEQFETLGAKVISLNNSRLSGSFKNKGMIQALVDLNCIDIVHSHGLRADMINSDLKNVCRFTTIHNFPKEDYFLQFGKIKGSIMAQNHQKAISAIENRIACSKYIGSKFLTEYGIESSCIQNGIDLNSFEKTDHISKTELRKKLDLPIGKKIFLVSGSLIKRKDPLTILKAFNELDQHKNCLVFIGAGKLEKELKSEYRSESIIFRGGVNNISDFLSTSDFFISASHSEGLPNAVLEAMHVGVPVILSNIPSHKEIVGDQYPFLFRTKNISDLEQKMNDMLKSLHILSWKSHSVLVKKNFNSKTMAMKYTKKYLDQCQSLVK